MLFQFRCCNSLTIELLERHRFKARPEASSEAARTAGALHIDNIDYSVDFFMSDKFSATFTRWTLSLCSRLAEVSKDRLEDVEIVREG